MSWWIATLKPGNKAPYLERCSSEDDADERIRRAEGEGLSVEKYHTGTDSIYQAKAFLRDKITRDFGYSVGNSNFRRRR